MVVVAAELLEYENRLKIGYRIQDKATSQRLTKGWSLQVAIDARDARAAIRSPKILLEKMRADEARVPFLLASLSRPCR